MQICKLHQLGARISQKFMFSGSFVPIPREQIDKERSFSHPWREK